MVAISDPLICRRVAPDVESDTLRADSARRVIHLSGYGSFT